MYYCFNMRIASICVISYRHGRIGVHIKKKRYFLIMWGDRGEHENIVGSKQKEFNWIAWKILESQIFVFNRFWNLHLWRWSGGLPFCVVWIPLLIRYKNLSISKYTIIPLLSHIYHFVPNRFAPNLFGEKFGYFQEFVARYSKHANAVWG